MLRTKSGLPKHCCWNLDREDGKRRVRFRKGGFSTYLTGVPWSEDFMRQYAAALEGVKAHTSNIGSGRTVAGTVNALVAAYLEPRSTSPFKIAAAETQRTRRDILENFREAHGDKPLFRTDISGRRTMLLTREHLQRIVNEKAGTPSTRYGPCSGGRRRKVASPTIRPLASPARRSKPPATRHGLRITSRVSRQRTQ